MMNWKGFGRKWSRSNQCTILEFAWTNWEPKKKSVRLDSVLAKIWTRHPQILVQVHGISAVPICLDKSAVTMSNYRSIIFRTTLEFRPAKCLGFLLCINSSSNVAPCMNLVTHDAHFLRKPDNCIDHTRESIHCKKLFTFCKVRWLSAVTQIPY
jgi:hypothetical protein